MVNKVTYLLSFVFVLLVISCRKTKQVPINIDCTELTAALKTNNAVDVAKQINAFFASREPIPTANDEYGYKTHFYTLAAQIDGCTDLTISYADYECYQTDPLTGQLMVTVMKNNKTIISRIYTSYDKILNRYKLKLLL